ncbi:lipopolysaccharide assembly protein LapA domain-containing protein [Psychromicrobium lacuslunae]|uniref:Lipopolysaccharide assembly protein A domain-containing protein n=1 Tax=Psychromicrobium lacuslunae TaxID=1618207 RepID=A0A0D4BZ89_9MICC|nr:LapA family protein [Psychromicrobium lacuslunae]AJT41614.1 hypothetical protein UM93_08990 [Psychromicrobium lacuslunae]
MSAPQGVNQSQENAFVRFLKDKWLAIVLVILVIIFIAQNTATVSISLLWWTLSSPLWVSLAAVLLVGAIIGYIISRRRQNRR